MVSFSFGAPRPVGRGAKLPLYHTLGFLSSENLHKHLAAKFPKLVQYSDIDFFKKIYYNIFTR